VAVALALLARAGGPRYVLAVKGSDANAIRNTLRQAGAVPVPRRARGREKWMSRRDEEGPRWS